MSTGSPGRVTRGYAWSLILADAIVAVSLLIAGWGFLSLATGASPVVSDVPRFVAPAIVVLGVGLLAAVLWRETVETLRGTRTPKWSVVVVLGGGAYLLWALLGTLAGMTVRETWVSPFALLFALIWAAAPTLFWIVFTRKLRGSGATPRWPWERDDEVPGEDGERPENGGTWR